jgi:hypothetical protein
MKILGQLDIKPGHGPLPKLERKLWALRARLHKIKPLKQPTKAYEIGQLIAQTKEQMLLSGNYELRYKEAALRRELSHN